MSVFLGGEALSGCVHEERFMLRFLFYVVFVELLLLLGNVLDLNGVPFEVSMALVLVLLIFDFIFDFIFLFFHFL